MANRKGSVTVLSVALCWLVTGIMMAVFIILQVVINPRNHAVPFSIVFGSDKRINHPGNPCSAIEIFNFDPTHNITVIFSTVTPSIDFEKNVEQILVNTTLEVGRNSDQLSYYGVPVAAEGDEVSLSVRAIDEASVPQSVDISVYDLDGFSRINANSATNPKFIYNLDRSCLLSATGCVASPTAESEGWFYFVFESEPSPSTLLVSLNSTVRKYDVDVSIIRGGCTLDDETSPICHIDTPKIASRSNSNRGSTSTTYLPFSLIYESNNILPYQNPPVQSLNVSTDLAWTCLRTDLWTYVIVAGVFGCCFTAVTIFILVACFSIIRLKSSSSTPNRRNHTNPTASTNLNMIHRPNVTPEKERSEFVRAESLPPTYEDLEQRKADDEPPYYS